MLQGGKASLLPRQTSPVNHPFLSLSLEGGKRRIEGNWEKGSFGVRVGFHRRPQHGKELGASGTTQPLSCPWRGGEDVLLLGIRALQEDEAVVSQVTLSPDTPGRFVNGSYFPTLGCGLLWRRGVGMVFPVRCRFPGMLGAGGGSRCASCLAPWRKGTSGSHRPLLLS